MLKKLTTSLVLLFSICFMANDLNAQQFVYKPINPAFGGDTFNYQWLVQSAELQNKFTDPAEAQAANDTSALDSFAAGINSQILSQLSRSLLDLQFDTATGLSPGVFSFGSLEVEILESLEGLVVNILDTTTGDQTQVIVPNQ